MEYCPPLGSVDPNAPFVEGNPATGTRGSYPPARGFEVVQREIVNALLRAGITPDDADLTQLSQAIRAEVLSAAGTAIFYINGSTGNDANDGSAGAPLRTIHEAFLRGRRYRGVTCLLQTDIMLTEALPTITGTVTNIYPVSGVRTLTFASTAWETGSDGGVYSMRTTGAADIYLARLNIINSVIDVSVPSLLLLGGGQLLMADCSYAVVSSAARPLIRSANGVDCGIINVTYDTTAGAKLFYGVASGQNPNIWPYRSNLTAV